MIKSVRIIMLSGLALLLFCTVGLCSEEEKEKPEFQEISEVPKEVRRLRDFSIFTKRGNPVDGNSFLDAGKSLS